MNCFTQNFPKFYNHRIPVDSPSGPFKSEYIVTLKVLQEMTSQDIFFCVPVPSYPLWVFFFKAPGISLLAFFSLVLLSTRLFLLPCLTAKCPRLYTLKHNEKSAKYVSLRKAVVYRNGYWTQNQKSSNLDFTFIICSICVSQFAYL